MALGGPHSGGGVLEQEEPGQGALEQDLLRTAQAEIWWPWVGRVGMALEQGLRGDLLSNPGVTGARRATQFWIWETGSPSPAPCSESEELLLGITEGRRGQSAGGAKATSAGDRRSEGWRAAPAPAQGVSSSVHVPCQGLKVRAPFAPQFLTLTPRPKQNCSSS